MKVAIFLLLIAIISACGPNEEEPVPGEQNTLEQNGEGPIIMAENLDIPWSIEKHEDMFYLTERTGNIVHIDGDQVNRQSVELEEEVSTASEAGLLGFALAPDFTESDQAYAYYTYEADAGQYNRIVLIQLEDDVWQEKELLLNQIPSGSVHHGGRLTIGPDDKIYATTGDAAEPETAQDPDSLGGNIVRLELDGSVPEDNPDSDSYVFSYGHRNPQGLAWAEDGTLYSSEHGDRAHDEINLIEAGQNYGWPTIEGEEEQDNLISPLFTSGSETTWAPSGMAFHNDILYVAALRGSSILAFNLESGNVQEVVNDFGRIRDVFIEEDTLYFITNNTDGRGNPDETDDKLYRISIEDL